MPLLLMFLGLIVWAVFSCLDDVTKQRKVQRVVAAKRPNGGATEYKIAYEKYHQYMDEWTKLEQDKGNEKETIRYFDVSDETWNVIESEIWDEVRAFPEVESNFRSRGLVKNELVKWWSLAYARYQVVQMGMNPRTYASGMMHKPAPTGFAYMYAPSKENPERWSEVTYQTLKHDEEMSIACVSGQQSKYGC